MDIIEDTLRVHVMQKFGPEECGCKRVVPRNVKNMTFNSFKVGIDAGKSNLFTSPDKWPGGITFSQWNFFTRKLPS